MPYIPSHQELRDHPKTKKLCRLLSIDRHKAVGLLHFLWWWTLDYAPNGDLSVFEPEDIADGIEWPGDARELLGAFQKSGFVDDFQVHDWSEYGGAYIQSKANNTNRMRAARAKSVQNTCDARATHVEAMRGEERREEDTREEDPREKEVPLTRDMSPGLRATCPHREIIDLYNSVLSQLPGVKHITESRKNTLRLRWKEDAERQALPWWEQFFQQVAGSDFLCGRMNGKTWRADFDWLIKPANLTHILEGRYQNRETKPELPAWRKMRESSDYNEFVGGMRDL